MWNPRHSQAAPDILLGSDEAVCPPQGRPLSSKIVLRVFSTVLARSPNGDLEYQPLGQVPFSAPKQLLAMLV